MAPAVMAAAAITPPIRATRDAMRPKPRSAQRIRDRLSPRFWLTAFLLARVAQNLPAAPVTRRRYPGLLRRGLIARTTGHRGQDFG